MKLQEKVELLDMYHRLRSAAVVAHHLKINESRLWVVVKKEKKFVKPSLQPCQQMQKSCTFCEILFLSHTENAAFMCVQIGIRKAYL